MAGGARLLVAATVPSTVRSFFIPYADHYRARGWQVDLVTGPGPEVGDLRRSFDRVHVVPWSRRPTDLANLAAVRQVRRLVRSGGYDILHTHTPVASLVSRAALIALPSPPAVVYTAHGFHFHAGGRPLANRAYAAVERVMGRWTDRLVVINAEDAQAARRFRIVPASRLVAMPGIGIDLDEYSPQAVDGDLGVGLELGAEDVLFSVVAELAPGKNHETVLRALARNGDPAYHLAFAGDGPYRPRLEQLVAELGLGEQVRFLGSVRDVRPLMLASAATVLLSRREGLSRSVLESLSLGVPVVGSTARGVRDLVGPQAGIVVDPDDVDAAARALDEVRTLPAGEALRAALADELGRHGLDRLLDLHDELYDELLARGTPRPAEDAERS